MHVDVAAPSDKYPLIRRATLIACSR